MTDMIDVKTKAEGASLTHPSGAVATNKGGSWPNDQFTARRLLDGDIIKAEEPKDETKAARGKLQKD